MLIKFDLAKKLQSLDIVPGNNDLWAYDPDDPKVLVDTVDEFYNSTDEYLETLIPTYPQSELQTFLRNRRILVEVVPLDSWDSWIYSIYVEDLMAPFGKVAPEELMEFPTYETALEAGLTDAVDFL